MSLACLNTPMELASFGYIFTCAGNKTIRLQLSGKALLILSGDPGSNLADIHAQISI